MPNEELKRRAKEVRRLGLVTWEDCVSEMMLENVIEQETIYEEIGLWKSPIFLCIFVEVSRTVKRCMIVGS